MPGAHRARKGIRAAIRGTRLAPAESAQSRPVPKGDPAHRASRGTGSPLGPEGLPPRRSVPREKCSRVRRSPTPVQKTTRGKSEANRSISAVFPTRRRPQTRAGRSGACSHQSRNASSSASRPTKPMTHHLRANITCKCASCNGAGCIFAGYALTNCQGDDRGSRMMPDGQISRLERDTRVQPGRLWRVWRWLVWPPLHCVHQPRIDQRQPGEQRSDLLARAGDERR